MKKKNRKKRVYKSRLENEILKINRKGKSDDVNSIYMRPFIYVIEL